MAWKLGSIGLARHKKCIGLGNMEWGLAQTVTSMPATLHLVSTAMRHMRGVWAIVHTAVTTSASHRVCILRGKHSDDLFFECPVGHAPFSLPLRVIFVVFENRPHLSPFGPFRATLWHFHHHFQRHSLLFLDCFFLLLGGVWMDRGRRDNVFLHLLRVSAPGKGFQYCDSSTKWRENSVRNRAYES